MPPAARKPEATRLRQAALLLAQDAREHPKFDAPIRLLLDEIARREDKTAAQAGAWLRGQLDDPDPPAAAAPPPAAFDPRIESGIRAIVRDEINAARG